MQVKVDFANDYFSKQKNMSGIIVLQRRCFLSISWYWRHCEPFWCWNQIIPTKLCVIMGAIASQITSLTIVYSIVHSDADQRTHRSSAALAFLRGNHQGPVNSPHKWPITRKMFPFDDVIMPLSAMLFTIWNKQSKSIPRMLMPRPIASQKSSAIMTMDLAEGWVLAFCEERLQIEN